MAFICAGQPVDAFAQDGTETGSLIRRAPMARLSDRPGLSDADRARAVAADYATCLVKRHDRDVRAFVDTPFNTDVSTKAMQRLNDPDCLYNAKITMPYTLVRGAIFRSLYIKDYGKAEIKVGDQPLDYSSSVGDLNSVSSATQLMLLEFAGCVIRKDFLSARKALVAEAGSDTEKNAYTALAPVFSPCMPQGHTVQFSKASLGAVMSEAMYRIAQSSTFGAKIPSGDM
jgi:hypothetical protein